jgi:hypothetical protein
MRRRRRQAHQHDHARQNPFHESLPLNPDETYTNHSLELQRNRPNLIFYAINRQGAPCSKT